MFLVRFWLGDHLMGTRCGVEEKIFQESRATLSGNVAGELSLHGDVVLLTLSNIIIMHA